MVETRPKVIEYSHSASDFDPNEVIPIPESSPKDSKNSESDIVVSFEESAIPYNFVTKAFQNYYEFSEMARKAKMEGSGASKRRFMVSFLPECQHLPPAHVNYLSRLKHLIQIDYYGGCNAWNPVDDSKKQTIWDRIRISHQYRFVLVWEPRLDVTNYISEAFYESLVFDALPVVMGATSLDAYLPADNSAVNARPFLNSALELVDFLQEITDEAWELRTNWKLLVSERKASFSNLWNWDLDSIVCRICHYSRYPNMTDPSAAFKFSGVIDYERLTLYSDQRRWYRTKSTHH
jgi:hypothetical protein